LLNENLCGYDTDFYFADVSIIPFGGMIIMENGNGISTYMPVAPAMNGYGDGGFGGGWSWWIIILLIFGGWGNGFGFGGNGNNGVGSEVQRGFDQSAVMNGLSGIQNSISAGFQNAETAAAARQMADMNQNFALQSSMQNCCCENRAATADLKYTIAAEACNNRQALADSTQKILDQMCQDKIDAKNEQIANLRQQLQMAQLAASQGAQTAQILANNEAQTAALEQYLAPVPRPAYIVQNPNGCNCAQNWCCGAA